MNQIAKFDFATFNQRDAVFEHQSFAIKLRIQTVPVYPQGFDAIIRIAPIYDESAFAAKLLAETLDDILPATTPTQARLARL